MISCDLNETTEALELLFDKKLDIPTLKGSDTNQFPPYFRYVDFCNLAF
jgi:hypothetical protein